MPKFNRKFVGVRDGKIYPETFEPGDDCPPELIEAAQECGVLEAVEAKARAKK
jgi:hypothetical protein